MKERLIKQLKKGNLTLEHSRFIDEFGFLRDFFEIVKMHEDGFRIKKPFHGMLKVQNYSKSDPIKLYTDYTEEDYEKMFEKNKF